MQRGRGRGKLSFSIEHVGFQKGDPLPLPVLQPPPLFPVLDNKPLPLREDEDHKCLLELRKAFRFYMQDSPYYLAPANNKTDIDRYSDKYQVAKTKKDEFQHCDRSRFPKELFDTKLVKRKPIIVQNAIKPKKLRFDSEVAGESDAKDENKDEKTNEEEDEEEKEIEEEVDEELDEGNDYMNAYFDNGESYLDDSDDNLDDGPVY